MIVLFGGGFYLGTVLGSSAGDQPVLWAIVFGMVGALLGLVVTPFLSTRPVRAIRARLSEISLKTMLAGLFGLIIGLVVGALIAFPLSLLPSPFGQLLPFIGAVLTTYLSITIL